MSSGEEATSPRTRAELASGELAGELGLSPAERARLVRVLARMLLEQREEQRHTERRRSLR